MPILTHTVEKKTKSGFQVLEVSAEINSKEDAETLGYDAFKVFLYVDGKLIADISSVLSKTDALMAIVDSIDWAEKLSNYNSDRPC